MNTREIIDFYKKATPEELFAKANEVCDLNYGNKVFLRGLVEFSNYCDRDCLYCGIRHDNTNVERYRLTHEQIIETVKSGYEKGFKTFVLQSGEDPVVTTEFICKVVEDIKKITNNEAAITLSCGIKTKREYREMKDAGADRYLIRFETSDPDLHKYLRNGISFKRRIMALEDLRECGYEVGSGYMVGLPEETEEIRINNALLCKELEIDMIGIGPFIPHPATPLKDAKKHDIIHTLKATALIRLLLPGANIPATTAAGSLDPLGREKVLSAGGNVLMPNLTPCVFKKNYLLYPGKICLDEEGFQCVGCMNKRVGTINKVISMERGDSLSIQHRRGVQGNVVC